MFEQELNEYWRTVVDTIQDGVMIVDTNGTIVSANRALEKISGYSRNEMIGQACSILNCDICEIAFKARAIIGAFCLKPANLICAGVPLSEKTATIFRC